MHTDHIHMHLSSKFNYFHYIKIVKRCINKAFKINCKLFFFDGLNMCCFSEKAT